MEFQTASVGFDGMVLEISVNGGAFADIVTAGGSFVTGGYTHTISGSFGSPIANRMAWSGLSAGTTAAPAYITTTANLPAAANGQNVQLRWRVATDSNAVALGVPGVRIDTITGLPCPPNGSISGTITYGNAIGAPAAPRFVKSVSLGSTAGSPPVGPVITGTPGTYTLTGFGVGSYTIRPTKPGGPNGSITSNDAARVAQGVTGALPFVSQNQRFAADVSGNGQVSSQDAAKIAQFVAGLTPLPTPNLTGEWRFFVTGAPFSASDSAADL